MVYVLVTLSLRLSLLRKYKDAHMMSQFQALSMDSGEEDGIQTREIAAGGQFSVGGMTSGSEDELYEIDLQK